MQTMRNRRTENWLRAMRFDTPEWIPCRVSLMPATWRRHRDRLEELVLAHPRIFPSFGGTWRDHVLSGDALYRLGRHRDCWGTVWDNVEEGLSSGPVAFPLEDWAAWETYAPPDPLRDDLFGLRDWNGFAESLSQARARGDVAMAGALPHGFMYMRLYYLRGFSGLMMDIASREPRLDLLIAMVESYNAAVVRKQLELGAEVISLGDDLGLQHALPMSPDDWRRYIKPSYDRILEPCRAANVPVRLHTDGHVLEIIDDLIDVGVTLLNPQIGANGLEGLRAATRGRLAIDLDLDRQFFPFATPEEIEKHIEGAVEELRLASGGLMLFAECEPDVSLVNIETICRTLERVCNLSVADDLA